MTYPDDDDPVDTTIDPDIAPPRPRVDHTVTFGDQSDEEPEFEDRVIVGELIEDEPDDPEERLILTSEERRDLNTLLTVGRRVKTVKLGNHQVIIQTLCSDDEMRIGLHTKPYLESQGFARAYQVGVCAAGIIEIKNQKLWDSLMPIEDPDEIFAKNVEALGKFYPVVITRIYDAIMDLEREFGKLALKFNILGDPAKK